MRAMFRHRNFQSVIGPLTFEAAFNFILFFNFRCNRAIISRSGAMFRHRIFQSLIRPLTFDAAFYFILFILILDLIGL